MMGRFGHLCKPAVAISTRPNLGTSAIVTTFWHPFADMAALEATGSVTLVRGEGSHVWDTQGNRYLDATAGLWFRRTASLRNCMNAAVPTACR